MAYDEELAERVRRVIPPSANIVEQKMFGGIAFLLDGKMFVGVVGRDLMVRVGAERYAGALARAHVRPMDFTGRPLTGFVFVGAGGWRTSKALAGWVREAMQFVAALPAKKAKKAKQPKPRFPRASSRAKQRRAKQRRA